jgi:TRAP transporter TAXI family solute receptor
LTTPPRTSPPPRLRRDPFVVAWLLVTLLAATLLATIARASWHRHSRIVRIATGPRGGTFLPVGTVLARALSRQLDPIEARAVETPGGAANLRRLAAGEADLALVANDASGGASARAIAPLYDEVLQLVAREGLTGADIESLRGHRVAIGSSGSGTNAITRRVLSHFDLLTHVEPVELSHLEAAQALERGDVDAMFVLAGLRAPAVERALSVRGAHLVDIGDPNDRGSALEGVRVDSPFLSVSVIPMRTYGSEPTRAIGTVGVRALLVARSDLSDDLVFDVTRTLFEQKVALASDERLFARLSERFDPGELQFPLHPGASRYYRRNDPPFIVAWADTLSLGLTALVMGASGFAALRTARRRRRKLRVERYYSEIQAAALARNTACDLEGLVAVKQRLHAIRRRAFDELMAERLEADESFTIFQDFVRSELLEIDAEIRERRGLALTTEGPPTARVTEAS